MNILSLFPANIYFTLFIGWTCLHEIITHGCQFTAVARVLLQHEAKYNLTPLLNSRAPFFK